MALSARGTVQALADAIEESWRQLIPGYRGGVNSRRLARLAAEACDMFIRAELLGVPPPLPDSKPKTACVCGAHAVGHPHADYCDLYIPPRKGPGP